MSKAAWPRLWTRRYPKYYRLTRLQPGHHSSAILPCPYTSKRPCRSYANVSAAFNRLRGFSKIETLGGCRSKNTTVSAEFSYLAEASPRSMDGISPVIFDDGGVLPGYWRLSSSHGLLRGGTHLWHWSKPCPGRFSGSFGVKRRVRYSWTPICAIDTIKGWAKSTGTWSSIVQNTAAFLLIANWWCFGEGTIMEI